MCCVAVKYGSEKGCVCIVTDDKTYRFNVKTEFIGNMFLKHRNGELYEN